MFKWLDNFSFPVLIIISIFLGMAPFGAQPHLVEKINLLMAGNLVKPLDIFDLIMHSTPIILLVIKTVRYVRGKKTAVN